MNFFELPVDKLILRFYLMMAIIIAAGFTGQWWIAPLGFFVFIGCITGMKFRQKAGEPAQARRMPVTGRSRKMRRAV